MTRAAAQGRPGAARPVGPVARVLVLLVGGYRHLVSPLLPQRCRFAPSCSRYAQEAWQVHGAVRGTWLAVRRLARCHPFHPGGHDPVPQARAAARGEDGARQTAVTPAEPVSPGASTTPRTSTPRTSTPRTSTPRTSTPRTSTTRTPTTRTTAGPARTPLPLGART